MTCPDCRGDLIVSPDQTPCVFEHEHQTWWDCPDCGASWEDEEVTGERIA